MNAAVSAHRLFFPLAAAFAAVVAPLWLAVLEGRLPPPAPPAVVWHAHEMLLGVAGAVIAGFLVARTSRLRLGGLVGAWLVARVAAYAGGWASWSALLFPLLLVLEIVPGFLRGAKQWSNLPFPIVPVGLVAAEAAFALGASGTVDSTRFAVSAATDLVLLLLVLMGGRLVRTATAGLVQRHGGRLAPLGRAREGASVLLLLLHPGLGLAGLPPALTAACPLLAGVLTSHRLLDWWTPLLRRAPEIAGLHLGYAWLAGGLFLAGLGEAGRFVAPSTGLHVALVGGFGTLAFTVSARTAAQRARRPFDAARGICRLAPLLSLAAAARLAADLLPASSRLPALWLAALLWSAAFVLLAVWLIAGPVARAGRTPARSSSRSR